MVQDMNNKLIGNIVTGILIGGLVVGGGVALKGLHDLRAVSSTTAAPQTNGILLPSTDSQAGNSIISSIDASKAATTLAAQTAAKAATDAAAAAAAQAAVDAAAAQAAVDAAAAQAAAVKAAAQAAAVKAAPVKKAAVVTVTPKTVSAPAAGAPKGTPLPWNVSSDPQNAQGGWFTDSSTFCAAHSASTVNGTPVCD